MTTTLSALAAKWRQYAKEQHGDRPWHVTAVWSEAAGQLETAIAEQGGEDMHASCDACGGVLPYDTKRCPQCGDAHKLSYGRGAPPRAAAEHGVEEQAVYEIDRGQVVAPCKRCGGPRERVEGEHVYYCPACTALLLRPREPTTCRMCGNPTCTCPESSLSAKGSK
jgi:hypothetical protein